ncbi:DUF2207 family protein [Nonomuraea sp. NPDC050556]|uniref:DUF2207 family protein n=1 Tax=Nonomuraea sp. NPDC050556 TaxID=3364369 RepID=UPI0037881188
MVLALTVATAVFVGLWVLQLLWRIRATKGPRSGKKYDQEFDDLSPAVVDLITENGVLSHEAATATVLDLAARRFVDIEEVGPKLSLVRVRRDGELRPYERAVLDHLRDLGPTVATEAIAEGSRDLDAWRNRFERDVVEEARQRGLTRKAGGVGTGMSVTGLIACFLLGGLADVLVIPLLGGTPKGGLAPPVILLALGLTTAFDRLLSGERLTARGRRAAGHWLSVRDHLAGIARIAYLPAAAVTIWGRQFAYAAAFGLPRDAMASLPILQPKGTEHVWSDHGGLWHRVRVRYPGESKALTGLILSLIFVVWVGSALGVSLWYALRDQGPDDPAPFFVSMFMLVGGGLITLVCMFVIFVPIGLLVAKTWRANAATAKPTRMVEGKVLRVRHTAGGMSFLAIDDGHRRIDALRALTGAVDGVAEGDLVRAWAGRGGYLARLERAKSRLESQNPHE